MHIDIGDSGHIGESGHDAPGHDESAQVPPDAGAATGASTAASEEAKVASGFSRAKAATSEKLSGSGQSFVDKVGPSAQKWKRNMSLDDVHLADAKASFTSFDAAKKFLPHAAVGAGAIIIGMGLKDAVSKDDKGKHDHLVRGIGELGAGALGVIAPAFMKGAGANVGAAL